MHSSKQFKRPETDSFWAITSYFNPLGYRNRLANYRLFRERLNVPLLAVETASGGRDFELNPGAADILIQLRSEEVLWQKERLLNIALGALPDHCRKVAWLDCDIVFESADWAERAERQLDRFLVMQLFSQSSYMPPDFSTKKLDVSDAEFSRASLGLAIASGLPPKDVLEEGNTRAIGLRATGLAWAARREWIEQHGFYDACVVGGGDRAMVSAYFGCFDHVMRRHCMHEREKQRYAAWAGPVYKDIGGAIGIVDGNIFHLWHGKIQHRRWHERHKGFNRFEFDPFEDIAIGSEGCWRWSSPKSDMHEYVREYFVSRREDDA